MIADKGTVRVPQQQRQRPDAFGPDVLAALEKITVGGTVSVGELTDRIDRSRISCEVSTDAAQPMTARACGPFPCYSRPQTIATLVLIPPNNAPGVFGWHRSCPRTDAWNLPDGDRAVG
uniref:Uncharacterized protein n=1 Tax=Anopheles melas TaxID=34690 RepID=A0A182TUK3_9DIPT